MVHYYYAAIPLVWTGFGTNRQPPAAKSRMSDENPVEPIWQIKFLCRRQPRPANRSCCWRSRRCMNRRLTNSAAFDSQLSDLWVEKTVPYPHWLAEVAGFVETAFRFR
jgi:hypothetical protein